MFRKKHYLAYGLALVWILMAIGPVFANDLESQQEQVQQQMQVQQDKKANAQQKVDHVTDQLRTVQMQLEQAEGDYRIVQAKLIATEAQIVTNTKILSAAEERLAERGKMLNKRVRDIYQNGQLSYLDVLLGANDFGDLTTRLDVLQRVIHKDLDLILKVRAERELILQTQNALTQDKASILDLKQVVEEKKKTIASSKKEQEKLLDVAVSERDTADQAYNDLMATSQSIEQMIRRNHSPVPTGSGPASGSGAMAWPTAVREITSPFGWRTHPIFGTQRYHSGIDIGADYGDLVSAADGGVVIFADWMGGYGKAVIIDHGKGISTLYGHNSELLVTEGQHVRKGEAISRVGSTGYSTGPHLHFEVRQDGSPVSPLNYLP